MHLTELKYVIILSLLFNFFKEYPNQVSYSQVDLLRRTLSNTTDVNTVDQFQGKDKDTIIYSCTRSRASEEDKENKDASEKKKRDVSREILSDARRLNVAMTRAKSKLVMIGDRRSLKEYEVFRKLFGIINDDQVVMLTTEMVEEMKIIIYDHLKTVITISVFTRNLKSLFCIVNRQSPVLTGKLTIKGN